MSSSINKFDQGSNSNIFLVRLSTNMKTCLRFENFEKYFEKRIITMNLGKVSVDDRIVKIQQENKHLLDRLAHLERYCSSLLGVPISRVHREEDDLISALSARINSLLASRAHSMSAADNLFQFVNRHKLSGEFELLLRHKNTEEKELLVENFQLFVTLSGELLAKKMYMVIYYTLCHAVYHRRLKTI